jgi:alpha-D-ribose 1-methylphosphonate 5-triphosphate diphosphatase
MSSTGPTEVTLIRGGSVVLADRVAAGCDVMLEGGRIAWIGPSGCAPSVPRLDGGIIDATGAWIAPGFIDIHSDYVEGVASPRPGVLMNLGAALFGTDRELVTYGVTTIYHSLSIYRMLVFDHKLIRRFENVSRLIDLINGMRADEARRHLIRHRVHMRVEVDAVDRLEQIEGYLRDGRIDLLSFMDHTPGQGQYRDLEVFGDTLKGHRPGVSDAEIREVVAAQQTASKITLEQMGRLARIARRGGIAVASHDDDSIEKLEAMRGIGVSISEFPLTLNIATAARAQGIHTIAGAPNVLLGYSHSGNLSARESICAGAADILCSDYYPAALLSAVFELNRRCGIDLARAFALVTTNPARATGIDRELGEIAVGKRADLLVIREHDGTGEGQRAEGREAEGRGAEERGVEESSVKGRGVPFVEQVLVDGRVVYRSCYPCLAKRERCA